MSRKTLPMLKAMQKVIWPDEPHFVADYKRHLIESLRRNRLSPGDREMLCQELEVMWFPTKALKQARRDEAQIFGAGLVEAGIKKLQSEDKLSVADAKAEIVNLSKLQSIEALEQSLKRARRKVKGYKK